MSAMASALVSISAGLRGLSEKCFPTLLSVVVISSPANARVDSEALGSAYRIKACIVRSPDALASRASGASR
jgi:hypothetical protein